MYVCMCVSINHFKQGGTGYTAYIVCVVYHFLPLFLSVERANVKTDVLSRMSLKNENDLKKLWLRALSTPQNALPCLNSLSPFLFALSIITEPVHILAEKLPSSLFHPRY